MKPHRIFLAILLGFLLPAAFAAAANDWVIVGEDLLPAADPKIVPINREISALQLHVTEGTIVINSIWVRTPEGQRSELFAKPRAFPKGAKQEFVLDSTQQIRGARISDAGKGKYNLLVK